MKKLLVVFFLSIFFITEGYSYIYLAIFAHRKYDSKGRPTPHCDDDGSLCIGHTSIKPVGQDVDINFENNIADFAIDYNLYGADLSKLIVGDKIHFTKESAIDEKVLEELGIQDNYYLMSGSFDFTIENGIFKFSAPIKKVTNL